MTTAQPAKPLRAWLVYGRFGKAREGQVIQEWRGHGRTMTVALRSAILDIMRRPEIIRLRHETATFTIESADDDTKGEDA